MQQHWQAGPILSLGNFPLFLFDLFYWKTFSKCWCRGFVYYAFFFATREVPGHQSPSDGKNWAGTFAGRRKVAALGTWAQLSWLFAYHQEGSKSAGCSWCVVTGDFQLSLLQAAMLGSSKPHHYNHPTASAGPKHHLCSITEVVLWRRNGRGWGPGDQQKWWTWVESTRQGQLWFVKALVQLGGVSMPR